MDNHSDKLRNGILANNVAAVVMMLQSGVDPNCEGGWPIRLAARLGSFCIVKTLVQYGANPHLVSESGASTLQLAVFSRQHWETEKWSFLLSCCDSSQLADGAAVAVVFRSLFAFKKILDTGRCNTNIPTTLTGKTIEELAKSYKFHYTLNTPVAQYNQAITTTLTPVCSPQVSRQNRMIPRSTPTPQDILSPSVARFFNQTANLTALSPSQTTITSFSPSHE